MQDNTATVAPDVYSLVTNKIIEFLEAGTIPWHKPWTTAGIPRNLLTKRPYRGINLFLLHGLGYPQNLYLTWKQIKTIGGSVKKGEKGHIIVFNKHTTTQQEENNEVKVKAKWLLRYYKVFNVSQCVDIPEALVPPRVVSDFEPDLECISIVNNMPEKPNIVSVDEEAYYVPSLDYINMPDMSLFETLESYYSALFHEVIHSTGHQKRIGRKEVYDNPQYGSDPYALEELIAEMGSCYLQCHSGIHVERLENNAAYIQGWLEVFNSNKRFVVIAASRAQQAVEYILKVPAASDQ